jgi:hypothetical protein
MAARLVGANLLHVCTVHSFLTRNNQISTDVDVTNGDGE